MKSRKSLAASGSGILLVGLLICGLPATLAQTSRPAGGYGEPVAVCEIADPQLDEASGLVASRRNPGFYYTHNDSQGKPHVYVLDRKGRIHATIRLVSARNLDWEDISLAPGDKPEAYDVCVADIGDNEAQRENIVIYRFPEPDLQGAFGRTLTVKPLTIRCKYQDGPRNAEGFAVHPESGDGYVFSKRFDGACHVYRLAAPWATTAVVTLRRVGSLKFPPGAAPLDRMVTAADISPDGKRLATRSYVGGWEWDLSDAGEFTRVFSQPPTLLELALEPQGEALCFSADGGALLTISERTPTKLYESRAVKRAGRDKP